MVELWPRMRERIRAFDKALEAGDTEGARVILPKTAGSDEAEHYVKSILHNAQDNRKLLDTALAIFSASRIPLPITHGYWVHSLTHFDGELWGLGKFTWLKDAYKTAFTGAFEFGNFTCCDELVTAFAHYAPWSEVPEDYGIQTSKLPPRTWGSWSEHIKLRLDASPFDSEIEFCRFLLANPGFLRTYNRNDIVDFSRIWSIILRQAQAGHNVTDLLERTEVLLKEELAQAKQRQKAASGEYTRKSAEKEIEMLQWVVGNDAN